MKKCIKRLTAVGSAMLVLAACSPNEKTKNPNEQALHISIGASPQSIDPHVVTGVPGIKVLGALCERLVSINGETYEVEPAAATHWEISDDALHYTFHLREDARWSNGKPLTAEDFRYGWKRALLPAVGWQYATDHYSIKGAENYHAGNSSDFSLVGVNAPDPLTLEFTLDIPNALFLKNLSHETTCPVNQEELEKHGSIDDVSNRWTDAGKFVSNGPFRLIEWEINKIIVAEKNPHYWDAKNIQLDKIYFYPIETEIGEERAFRAGQIQVAYGGTVPSEKIATYKRKAPEKLKIVSGYGTYFYLFNTTKAPFDNANIRKAFALTIDRDSIVTNITKTGEKPASTLSILDPAYNPDFSHEIYNPEKARQLLAEAGFPEGKGFPEFTLIYNTTDVHKKVALAIQQMWKKELGINVLLENQEWKIFLDTRQHLHFDVARAGLLSSFADPQDFLSSFTTGHGMNDTGWSNQHYDKLFKEAATKTTDSERFKILAEAEKILLDQLPLIPIYHYSHSYLIDPSVKGMEFNAIERINYKDVYIEKTL